MTLNMTKSASPQYSHMAKAQGMKGTLSSTISVWGLLKWDRSCLKETVVRIYLIIVMYSISIAQQICSE